MLRLLIYGLSLGWISLFPVSTMALGEARLSPRIRVEPLKSRIQKMPTRYLRSFLEQILILDPEEFKKTPCLIAHDNNRLASSVSDLVFVSGLEQTQETRFTIVEAGQTYCDPKTKEVLGFEALAIGEAQLEKSGAISSLRILSAKKEIEQGVRFVPAQTISLPYEFEIAPTPFKLSGHILSVKNGLNEMGKNQVVVLSVGSRSGLARGEILDIFQKRYFKKVSLPDKRVGSLLVFKTYEKLSVGLILESEKEIELYDEVRTP